MSLPILLLTLAFDGVHSFERADLVRAIVQLSPCIFFYSGCSIGLAGVRSTIKAVKAQGIC